MNADLKKQILIGVFAIIVALIGAAGAIIPTMRNQEFSTLKEENSQLRERILELENESEVSADTNTNSTNADANFDEDPIAQNLDAILQKKAEYADSDTLLIKNERVWVDINEKAGYICNDLQNTGEPTILAGRCLDSITVYFLDYETNNVIYTLSSSKNGTIEYYPGNTKKFFCVVITSEYELFVSQPIQALGGENLQALQIFLDKADSRYSPLFQVRLQACDSSQTTRDFYIPSTAVVSFQCVDRYSDHNSFPSSHYKGGTTSSGIIQFGSKCYFSLNTRYVLDVSLKVVDVSSGEEMLLPYKTIDGSIKNTNLIDIFFQYDGNKVSLQ